jgi:hypothetical protein
MLPALSACSDRTNENPRKQTFKILAGETVPKAALRTNYRFRFGLLSRLRRHFYGKKVPVTIVTCVRESISSFHGRSQILFRMGQVFGHPASIQPAGATTMISLRFDNSFAFDPDDSDDLRTQKMSIFLVASSCCVAGLFWSAMYFAVFGAGLIAAMPLLFSILVGTALIASHNSRDQRIAIYTQIACIVYITTAIQLGIGSVLDSGFVMVWALLGPLIALMFLSVRAAIVWQALFLVNIVVVIVFDDVFAADGQVVTSVERNLFFVMNIGIASSVIFAFAGHFVRNALDEK